MKFEFHEIWYDVIHLNTETSCLILMIMNFDQLETEFKFN